jgi:hypothetical protein
MSTRQHISPSSHVRPARGRLAKRCRTCHDLHPVTALTFGQCDDCADLVALPVRGPGGRFVPYAATSGVGGGSQ